MNTDNRYRIVLSRPLLTILFLVALSFAGTASAATWNNIEPFKSKRADVERILGRPEQDDMSLNNSLRFKVAGGTVVVSFVDAKFAATKKLSSDKVGTVQQIMLQHDSSTDTPESLNLIGNKQFEVQESGGVAAYRNVRDGIAYTFINGKLKTSYFFSTGRQGIPTMFG